MADSSASLVNRYPKHIALIFICVCLEQFCYYGISDCMANFIHDNLGYSPSVASMIKYVFVFTSYTSPILGAVLADNWIGKIPTIVLISILYICGTVFIFVSSIMEDASKFLFFTGFILMLSGCGPIKPCIITLAGDQYLLPLQRKELQTFYYIFYFFVHLGTAAAETALDMDMCPGSNTCYTFTFGICSLAIASATIIFILAKSLFFSVPPESDAVTRWTLCIGEAFAKKITAKEKTDHWLDYSKEKYGDTFVEKVKQTLQILLIFSGMLFYFALYGAKAVNWKWQASFMDGNVKNLLIIAPEQMPVTTHLFILILIPVFCFIVFPIFLKYKITPTPLRRMACGAIFAAISFFIGAFVSLDIQSDVVNFPKSGKSHMRIYNPLNCTIVMDVPPYINNKQLQPMSDNFFEVKVEGKKLVSYQVLGCGQMLTSTSGTDFVVNEEEVWGYYVAINGLKQFKETVIRKIDDTPVVRTLVGNPGKIDIVYKRRRQIVLKVSPNISSSFLIESGKYSINDFPVHYTFYTGGLYRTLIFFKEDEEKIEYLRIYELIRRSHTHMLWQIPQCFLFAIAEVLIAPTGYEFVYTQTPESLKTLMAAIWLLLYSFGLSLKFLIDITHEFKNLSNELFLWGALTLLNTALFIFLARRYKYVDKNYDETTNE